MAILPQLVPRDQFVRWPRPVRIELAQVRAALAHRPTPLPDRLVLTWKEDPAVSQAVTWRTDTSVARAWAELGPCDDSGAFAGYGRNKPAPKTTRHPAQTTLLRAI